MNISRYFVDSSSLDWAGSGCCVCLLYAQHLAVVEGEDRAGGQRDAAGEADGLQPRPGLTQLKIYHRLQIRADSTHGNQLPSLSGVYGLKDFLWS